MSSDATVNAGDIARLAGVGRAAVSNWRRRYADFPRPVGGTATNPEFSLHEVEGWLRKNGKDFEVSLGDRVWQRLRASGEDLRLGASVGRAGAFLLYLVRDPAGWRQLAAADGLAELLPVAVTAATADLPHPPADPPRPYDPELAFLIAELAAERGPAEAFELLCARYTEAHARRLDTTRPDIADLMVRLSAPPGAGVVLDPACGIGTLLLATRATRATGRPGGHTRVLGQEVDDAAALIAAARLLLRGAHAEIISGDALRRDAFPGGMADAVVCHPPFNERAWGFDELTGDPRWEYGLPPRGESELAWVQHCLSRVRPGGTVAILMPPAAASRRSGRRIRGNLLRAGALRGVVTLSVTGPDLWLLRRPEPGLRPPSRLLLVDAGEDLSLAERAWTAYTRDVESVPPGAGRTVRIIDLLDDEVDLSPTRHRPRRSGEDLGRDFAATRARLRAASDALAGATPDLRLAGGPGERLMTSVGELVRAGLVAVHQAPFKMATGGGDVPVLMADDVAAGQRPSGRTADDAGLVPLEARDVVITPPGAVRVLGESLPAGAVLGPQLTLYRVDPDRLDPDFLAGFLRFAGASAGSRPGASRADARRARLPRLPLPEQQAYGRAFRELVALEDGLRETAALGESLIRLGFEGLVDGHLQPYDQDA
ncbi:SAM-dependent methyltransferase [Microtetraspora sp. NBRC 13810]|uniref:N-6 DNA methylase n=1 Tax=Microtetraspora sp. NBRC 13810 TaxID=3030990 RepID=UPI0024A04AF6|nr:N-6 DNA methylase [Microtetraspora sp. NBRC 13810]GLW05915.1 SAM-dependent methyltransferase [Microtetraspora sp. NBRC 13810]